MTKLLSQTKNGATIIASKKSATTGQEVVLCIKGSEYVTWIMDVDDIVACRACYSGHYFVTLAEAVIDFAGRM